MTASQGLVKPVSINENLVRKIRELEARIAQLESGMVPSTRVGFDPRRIQSAFGVWGRGGNGKDEVRRIRDESEKRRKRMKL